MSQTPNCCVQWQRIWIIGAAIVLVVISGRSVVGENKASALSATEEAVRGGHFADALRLTDMGLKKTPQDYKLWTLRGIAFAGSGNEKDALVAYQHAISLSPNFIPALQAASQAAFVSGSRDAAPLLKRLLALTPTDATANAMLAVTEARSGNCQEAVRFFERAQVGLAGQAVAMTEYGVCLATLGRYEDALTEFRTVKEQYPDEPTAIYNLALDEWKAGHEDDAIQVLKPSIDSSTAGPELLALAADIYEDQGDTPTAVELLRKSILQNPTNLDAYLAFSTLSVQHTSEKVGIDMLSAGIERMPNEARLYLERGILYARLGNYEQATNNFDTARRLDPKLSMIGTAEGLLQEQEQHTTQALAIYSEEVIQNPSNSLSQFLLAEALSNEANDKDKSRDQRAIEAANRAVTLDPTFVAAHDLLGRLYLRTGKISLAIEHSRAALEIDASDGAAIYNLIQALREAHQTKEIPALAKRLGDLEAGSLRGRRGFRLEESPPASPSASPN